MRDDFFKRCGRFSVNRYMLATHPDEMLEYVFSRLVIVRAECMFSADAVEYTAYCEDFDLVQPGDLSPLYEVLFTRHEDATVTLQWRRVP